MRIRHRFSVPTSFFTAGWTRLAGQRPNAFENSCGSHSSVTHSQPVPLDPSKRGLEATQQMALCACGTVAASQGDIVSQLSAPLRWERSHSAPRAQRHRRGCCLASPRWRAPRTQSKLQPAARARQMRRTKTPTGQPSQLWPQRPHGPSNGYSRLFQVEGPPRSAHQAPRAHTGFQRPRRVTTHRSRSPPTIVRRQQHDRIGTAHKA